MTAPLKGRAALSTVEALVYALRRGLKGLETVEVAGKLRPSADNMRRLAQLSEQQLHEVCARLQRFKPHIARAWTPDEIATFVSKWNACHG